MYTNELLISELHRFVSQYGQVPTAREMGDAIGYPSSHAYLSHFETWNGALQAAGLPINRNRIPFEGIIKCAICGDTESSKWHHGTDEEILCHVCHGKLRSDYMHGLLNPVSNVGVGLIAEKLISKTLGISVNNHCNVSCRFNHAFDLYSDSLGTINVKSSTFDNERWGFNLRNKYSPDTYILVAFSKDRRDVSHVWIIPSSDELVENKIGLSVRNTAKSLSRMSPFERCSIEFNNSYHSMSLDNCPYMGHGAKIASMKITSAGVEMV